MDKPTTESANNPDYDKYADFLLGMDEAEPASESFKESLAFYKKRIDALNAPAEQEAIGALLAYLGPTCSIDLLSKVKAVYVGRLYEIEHFTIPTLFASEGLDSMKFDDKSEVKIDVEYESKTVDKEKTFAWLKETGNEDAIRDTLQFSAGAFDEKAKNMLVDAGYSFEIDRTVNGATLKKIVTDYFKETKRLPPADAIKFRAEKVAIFKYPKKGF